MKPESFLKGTAILVAAAVVTKIFGALFTIPLARLIGAEGVGLLHMASPVFTLALVLCMSGLPVATSKLVAERLAKNDRDGARQVLLVCLAFVIPVGGILAAALREGADLLSATLIGDPRAYLPMRFLSPILLVSPVAGVLRGYFQGHRTMVPTAVSQVAEQVVRVVAGLGLAYALLPRGVHWAAGGAAAGGVAGAVVGLCMLAAFYCESAKEGAGSRFGRASSRMRRAPRRSSRLARKPRPLATSWATLRQLLSLAGPTTLAALVIPLLDTINALIVPARLQQAGFAVTEATRLYGHLAVMAVGLVALPGVVTAAVATNLVPQVAAADAGGEARRARRLARQAVRSAVVLGLPAAAGLGVLPTQICSLLFNDPAGGVPLSAMAFASVFFCLQQTTAGVLNGFGKVLVPARNGLVGAVLAGGVNYVLTAVPGIGIRGAAFGTGLAFLVAGALNTVAVARATGEGIRLLSSGWRVVAGCAAMVPAVKIVYRLLLGYTYRNSVATVAAIAVGASLYGFILLVLGEIAQREVAAIPLIGRPLAHALRSSGILRR
ncbi:MAG: polysaccharide biosynthesis protein [Firmicutes bacterium]|jgi:stage V sporulation protein B|nr:polysaccharide biosynthesis protein [Bacillota bacterium]MDH7495094.1 polysaccharide biosynthesis protein [Bacillota bacterium]